MTAEIAVLNKSAVALAADSAVTISAGNKEEKTFDSADKLFELCRHNAIAVMIYNGLSFAEAPLHALVKKFRAECPPFVTVKSAANSFLEYLNSFGQEAPSRVKDDSIGSIVGPDGGSIGKFDLNKKTRLTRDGDRRRSDRRGRDISSRRFRVGKTETLLPAGVELAILRAG